MNTFTLIAHKMFICDIQYTPDINITNMDLFTCGNYMKSIFKQNADPHDNLHLNFTKCSFLFIDSKRKFATLNDNFINSFFVTLENKQLFLDFFCRVQRTYNALNNFAYLIKKRNKTVIVTNDLYLTPINKSQNNVFNYYENNYIYLFTIQDLSRIIISAICNSPLFYSESLPPKNPYSGVEFQISDLYNIYFHMKDTLTHVPLVIQQYYLSGFNIDNFEIENQVTIRNIYIEQFCENEDHDTVIEYIDEMIEPYKISIHNNFPKKTLITTFKPYLVDYLHSRYSLDGSKKHIRASAVKKKLSTFARMNPTFGRRIIVFKEKRKYYCFITLDGQSELIHYKKEEIIDTDDDDYSASNLIDDDDDCSASNLINDDDNTPNLTDDDNDNTPNLTDDDNDDDENIVYENIARLYTLNLQSSNSSIHHAFIESAATNLFGDEMVFPINTEEEEEYFDSDDEIEIDESLYDP